MRGETRRRSSGTRFLLKQARTERGMTQQQVADQILVSLRYYQAVEAGTRIGSIEVWDALEDLFGINQRVLRRSSQAGNPR